MTRAERRLAARTAVLGAMLTVSIVAMEMVGVFGPLEKWLYDQRTRTCQFFAPPPADELVYIDIDDQSLVAAAQFPWPRQTMAAIVDEIHRAGAKVLAFDVIFSEPQKAEPLIEFDDAGHEIYAGQVDHDAILARACENFGNVIIPVSLALREPPRSAVYSAVRDVLISDLELSPKQIVEKIRQRGSVATDLETGVNREFPEAIRDAFYARVSAETATTRPSVDQLRTRLLPHTGPSVRDSYLLRLLTRQYELVEADREFRRFARPLTPDLPPLATAHSVIAPIPQLGRVAVGTGYVDYLSTEGVVRSMPLFIRYRDGVYPQEGFALACAMLDISPQDTQRVKITADKVTLLPDKRAPIVIPVRTIRAPSLNAQVGTFIDVPWYGDTDWSAMYDRFGKNPHLLVNDIWQLCQSRRALEKNNAAADENLKVLLSIVSSNKQYFDYVHRKIDEALESFFGNNPSATSTDDIAVDDAMYMLKRIDSLFKDMTDQGLMEEYRGKRPEDYQEPKERSIVTGINILSDLRSRTPALLETIANQEKFLKSRLEGKAALLGYVATAAAASDFVPTPLNSRCPGVVVHGTVFNGIMTGELWRQLPPWVSYLCTILVGALTTAAVGFFTPWKALAATVAVLVAYALINGIVLFDYFNLSLPGAGAGVLAVAAVIFAGGTASRLIVEQVERARITRRFSAYNDPSFVDYIVEHPELEEQILRGQVRELTIVFTDMAGYTSLSEALGEKIVPLLNEYLGDMVPVVRNNRGLVNKFIGDGIMCFFGAPKPNEDHAADAVACVLGMQRAVVSFNQRLVQRGLDTVFVRAGIATGKVVVGNAGAPDRADYTVLGNDVNLSSRLETANKQTGTRNLLTQRTADLVKDRYLLRPIGKLVVVGRQEAVMTYEAIAPQSEATPEQLQLAKMTTDAVNAYMDARVDECLQALDRLDQAFGDSKLTALYRSLCQLQKSTPAADFDGLIVLSQK